MKRAFRSIFFFAAFFAAFSAFCEVDAYSSKYNVEIIDRIYPVSEVIIPLIENGTVVYDGVSEYAFSKMQYSLGSLIYDSAISTINSGLLSQLNDKSLNSFVIAHRIVIVNNAINNNYTALMQMYDSFLGDYMDAGFISRDEFKQLKTAYETTRAANIGDIEKISGATDSISQKMAGITASLNDVVSRLNALKNTPQEGMTEAQRNALIAEINRLTEERIARALEAEAVKRASSVQEKVVFVGGGGSIADFNFTNAVVSISKFLGAGNEVNTNGVTFVPPTIDGDPAPDILAYLNSNGVVGYQSDDSGGPTNSPFSARFESNGTNVVATFGAPVNWADGRSIIVTNGTMSIVSGSFWHYDQTIGAFVGCSAQVGSKTFFEPTMAYDTPGTVYALIDYSGAELTLTLTSSSSSTDGRSIAIAVGTLVSSSDGGVYSQSELGQPIVVFCYE